MTSDAICEFCYHEENLHSNRSPNGCLVSGCHCAVYSEPGTAKNFEDYQASLLVPVTITAQELANKIHSMSGRGEEHLSAHSCGCNRLALYYLGLRKETGMYWPDGQGGNAWKR